MGYSHNWTIVLPKGNASQFMFDLESKCLVHLLPNFDVAIGDAETTHLQHKSGQAEGFALGTSPYEFGESSKTSRGIAEVHVVEMLWRTAFAINDSGGEMQIHSDCTFVPMLHDGLSADSALFLAVLMHRCSDLVEGRTVEVKAVPQAWPVVSDYRDIATSQNRMLDCAKGGQRFDCVLFGSDDLGDADFNVELQHGTPSFTNAVYRHTQEIRFNRPVELRGLLSHNLHVRIDGKLFAGRPAPHDQHAEVVKRSVDLAHLIPDAQWLKAEEAERLAEDQVDA